MIKLTSKQRRTLEKFAHDLRPVVIVGGSRITDGVIQMVASSLASHELIKVKFNEYKDEKAKLAREIEEQCDATLIRIIGNVAIFYKEAKNKKDRKYTF